MRFRRIGLTLALAATSGCTVGPDYHTPAVAVPRGYSNGAAAAGPDADMASWWLGFGDPVLDDLIARAFAGNLDLQQAAARVRQAREQERAVRAAGGPKVDAAAQGSYIALSENAPPVLSGGGAGVGVPGEGLSTFTVGFDASWELDVFGGQRRANEVAGARSEAAAWSERDAEVMLAAEVARVYQDYRAVQRRIALADATLVSEREELGLIETREANGLVSSLDPRRQEREIEQLAAQRADLVGDARVHQHALATLLGLAPAELATELASPAPGAPTVVTVPAGLPSDLLLRRPDLRAAERQLAAATADIGVATADLYPRFNLTGALKLISFSLVGLIENGGILAQGSGGASFPLIGRGGSESTVRLRRAQADEALLAYRARVLVALRDVEDALTRIEADGARVERLRAATVAAEDAAETARVRYRNGLTPQIDVLEAQQAALSARDALTLAEAASAQDLVSLYKALGGGWDERRVPIGEEAVIGRND